MEHRHAFAARIGVTGLTLTSIGVITSYSIHYTKLYELHQEKYSDVQLEHMYADNCAMQLVRNPRQFDVIVTDKVITSYSIHYTKLYDDPLHGADIGRLGQQPTPFDDAVQATGFRETVVADAANYYGTVPLADPADQGRLPEPDRRRRRGQDACGRQRAGRPESAPERNNFV